MSPSDDNKPAKQTPWLPMAAIACIAIAAGVFAGTRQSTKAPQDSHDQQAMQAVQAKLENATLFPNEFKQLPAFSLPYGDDKILSEADFKGKWSVLFFGFTHCPDICPNTLNEMNGVVTQLAADQLTVPQVIFISVDPVRDTVEKVTEYVGYFNEEFIGVSGDLTDITALTTELGIVASYTADTNGGNNYSVDHTASMLVIDPELRVRAKLNPPHKLETISADLKTLMARYN